MSDFNVPHEHELWLKTGGKEGRQLDLTDNDFCGKDLTNSMIIDVIFDGSNMDQVDLTYSNLGFSSFKGTSLWNSIIVKADANHTNFEGANLYDCNLFRSTFIGSNFRQANMTKCQFFIDLVKRCRFYKCYC